MPGSNRICALLATCLLATPAVAQQCNSLRQLEWLLGDWRGATDGQQLGESWRRVSADTLEGEGYSRASGGEKRESLRLLQMAGRIFYLAKVEHNEYPVPFALTGCSGRSAVFENPQHDFPRRLEYRLLDTDYLQVMVGDGKGKNFLLEFRRAPAS